MDAEMMIARFFVGMREQALQIRSWEFSDKAEVSEG
jgi:hypothetical protein